MNGVFRIAPKQYGAYFLALREVARVLIANTDVARREGAQPDFVSEDIS
jgi:hypothetical protein